MLAENNPFPSILVTEGTEPTAPSAGDQRLYIDSTTHHLKRTDSAGADVDLEDHVKASTATTKGDLFVATGSGTVVRLGVGIDGQVLTAASAETAGVKWAGAGVGGVAVGARAYRSAAKTMSAATVTPLDLDGESWDTGTLHDLVTNPSRITVPSAGKYLVTGKIAYGTTTGQIQCRLHKNGTSVALSVMNSTNPAPHLSCTDVIDLAAGDYIELAAYQASGTTGLSVGVDQTYLSVVKVG